MKKVVTGLLYMLLLVVTAAGLLGMGHFIVQDKERVRLEEEKRLAEAEADGSDAENGKDLENIRMVLVKKLPVYQKKKITKVKADSGLEMLSYGDEVTVLAKDGLYTKIRTKNKGTGYVWSDCIGVWEDGDSKAAEPLKVVVIDVKPAGKNGEEQEKAAVQDDGRQDASDESGQAGDEGDGTETGQNSDEGAADESVQADDDGDTGGSGQAGDDGGAGGSVQAGDNGAAGGTVQAGGEGAADGAVQENVDQLCLGIAGKLEKRLEASGYVAVMTGRAQEDAISDAKRAELANQIKADAVIQLCMENSEDPASGGARVYCSTKDSPHPAAAYYRESRKLGKTVLKYYAETTGIDSEGIAESSVHTGINLSERPVVILNLGNQLNEQLALKMQKPKFQSKMAKGIADGVDAYFGNGD